MADLETRDGRSVETRSSTPGWLIAIIVVVALVVAAFAFGLVNIDQVREAKVPDVKVETSGGQAPVFDVDTAKIEVGETRQAIEVPTVDVGTKESSVTLPTVRMERADDPNARDK
jgi:hypothetical protein